MAPNSETAVDAYYLGVDGGGTKTLAVIVDAAGAERGRGLAGCANFKVAGVDAALNQVDVAIQAASAAAGCRAPFAAAWLGLSGVDAPPDQALLLLHLRTLAEVVRLSNDAELALGALPDGVGVALIAGTGSIALGRNAAGMQARAGGWGHLVGDEGSGYDMGRSALQAALRAADGRGPSTTLLDDILAAWELGSAAEIIGRVYPPGDKAEIARLSRLVFAAATAGDRVADRIVRRGAAELARAALAVGAALAFDGGPLPLALGGGLLLHEARLRDEALRLMRRAQTVDPVALVAEPALSAALASRSMRGGAATIGR